MLGTLKIFYVSDAVPFLFASRIIITLGGIPGLVELLKCPIDKIMFPSISSLHNILLSKEADMIERAKDTVRRNNGVRILCENLVRR